MDQSGTSNQHQIKVLVVDDDASIRELFAAELRYRGYMVRVARNGNDALECLEMMTPDVIVLDLMMPVMDGWTFVERFRDHAARAYVSILAVSAEGDLPAGYTASGVRAFLRKPVDLNELAHRVAQLTRARDATAAPRSSDTATLST